MRRDAREMDVQTVATGAVDCARRRPVRFTDASWCSWLADRDLPLTVVDEEDRP